MGLGGVAIAVPPYVIHPKTAVLGRAGGGKSQLVQVLIWFGRNSLCLMLVHQLIKTILDEYIGCLFSNDLFYMCFQFLGTIFLSVVLTLLINNYTPMLIGKKTINVTRK